MRKLLSICVAAWLAFLPSTAQLREVKKVELPAKSTWNVQLPEMQNAQKVTPAAAVADAEMDIFEGRTFYANLINSDTWANFGITEVPYGVYSYTFGEDADFKAVSTNSLYNFMASVYARHEMIGVYPMSLMGVLTGVRYLGLEAPDFQTAWEEVHSEVSYGYIPSALAYDPTNDQVYAAMYNDALNGLNWAVFDPATRRFNTLAAWPNDFQPAAMAATPDGRIYCVGLDGFYYEMNKTNGEAEMVGETGVEPTAYVQAMIYDVPTNSFLWFATTPTGSTLYAVDAETGAASKVQDLVQNEQVSSIFFLDNQASAKAPAAIDDLDIAYSANGALDGNITFTIPSTTFDGAALAGNVDMTLYVDGEVEKQGSVTAGSAQTFPVTLTNDNHYIYVLLENEAGFSPYNYIYEYAGYDVPLPVTGLTLEISEEGESQLTWTAPAGGVNGGYIDFDNLTYTIIRMPEGVTVQEGLKGTSFTETCPVDMARYSYQVIPYNGADKPGEAVTSNQVLYGNAFSIPYHDVFTTDETMTFYSYYTADSANNISAWSSYNQTVDLKNQNTWFITPAIAMEAGKAYCATYTMRNSFGADSVEVYLGTNVADSTSFRLVNTIDSMATLDYTYYDPFESDFVVDASGDYHVGVVARKNWIFIKQIDIVEIGSQDAPKAVDNLTITPDAEGAMTAVVGFTLPTQTLAGADLTGTLAVNIYRDGGTTPVGTLDNLTAGAQASWTDEAVEGAVGVHSYTVRVSNAAGEGKWMTAEAFIGVYTPPYTNTFDEKSSGDFFVTENFDNQSGNECRWKWSSYAQYLELSYYVQHPVENIWLYMPAIQLEKDEVYELSFIWNHSLYGGGCPGYVTIGMQPTAEAQTDTLAHLPNTDYGANLPIACDIVTDASGKHYPSVYIKGDTQNAFIMPNIDSLVIKHVTSAFAPYKVENLTVEHNMEGKLEATLSFDAPTTDFAGRDLTENFKVDIFRGAGSAIPVHTFDDVQPGQELSWTDILSEQGLIDYLVVATNEAGRGKEVLDTTYVGIDIPQAVTGLVMKGNAANTGLQMSWTAPEVGMNGGVLDESLEYVIIEYFPTATTAEEMMAILGTTKETSFEKADIETSEQVMHYYGVITQTSTGVGGAIIDYTVLGPLYELPFRESFANGALSTSGWVGGGDNTQAAIWNMSQDTELFTSQDEDNGFAVFYNGVWSETYYTGWLISSKFRPAPADNQLTFYVYRGLETTAKRNPGVIVSMSVNDGDYVDVCDSIFVNEGNAGWQPFTIDLDIPEEANYISLQFKGFSSLSSEYVPIDNVEVTGTYTGVKDLDTVTGMVYGQQGAMLFTGLQGNTVEVYNVSGVCIDRFMATDRDLRTYEPGVYVVSYNGTASKVMVR